MIHQIRILPSWLLLLLLAALLPASGSVATAATVELVGPAGAAVFLDGSAIGFLPLAHPLELDLGTHLLRCDLPGYHSYEDPVVITDEEDHTLIRARMTPLRRRAAVASNFLFAGLGQHYTGNHIRGWIYTALEAGGLITAITAELDRSNLRKEYLLLKGQYDVQINANEIEFYRQETLATYAEMEDAEKLRDTALLVTSAAVTLSILDSLFFFPSFDAGFGSPASMSRADFPGPDPSQRIWDSVHLSVQTNF